MNKLIFLLFITAFCTDALADTWKKLGGAEIFINSIRFSPDNAKEITVASDPFPLEKLEQDLPFVPFEGVGYKVSHDKGETFGDAVFEGNYVVDMAWDPFDKSRWYMSYILGGLGYVAVSNDNRKTWDTEASGCKGTFFISQICPNPEKENEFFSAALNTSTGAIHTSDGFATCAQNVGPKIHAGDVKFSPANGQIIYMAGKRNYGVYRSLDGGKTWARNESGLENLRVLTVQPSAFYPYLVYCGADSLDAQRKPIGKGIYQSLDSGRTFHRIAGAGHIIHNISAHPSRPELMVAACGTGGVLISCNDGYDWNPVNGGLPEGADIRLVAVSPAPVQDNKMEVYAAAWGDGLYRSEPIRGDNCELVSVEEERDVNAVFSAELRDGVITVRSSGAEEFDTEVYDISGRLLFSGSSNGGVYAPGSPISAHGVYLVKAVSGRYVFTAKMIR